VKHSHNYMWIQILLDNNDHQQLLIVGWAPGKEGGEICYLRFPCLLYADLINVYIISCLVFEL